MDKIPKKILEDLENSGFEAYIVGGYVRDYLLGIKSLDIDICTNALPKDLHKLFPVNNNSNNYGGFNLNIKNYNIDITTYRKELKYDNRKPTEIEYVNSLEEDILRRDFTINSICLDKNGKIIDLVNGINDLNNCNIKMLGNIKERLQEDPLRILRAVRFATILNFNLDKNLYNEIRDNSNLVTTLSTTRIKEELSKILMHKNFLKGLKLLKELNVLNSLEIEYNDDIVYVNDICGMWSQLQFNKNYSFTKQENLNIINIRQIVNEGNINNETLYKYGLYKSLVAASILSIDTKVVNKMYNNLQIKSEKELQISNEDIMNILNIEPSKQIKEIKNILISEILCNNLKNNYEALKEYIINMK